jgi:hypothetical protein
MGCLLILALMVLGPLLVSREQKPADQRAAPGPASLPPREEALRQVKLDFSWSKGAFDNVMLATFVIKNPTSRRLKDIEVTCKHFAPSGTQIDRNVRTIYEIVPPKSSKNIERFNMGFIHSQAQSSACAITNLVVE